jgi:hypothetical protein
MPAFAPRIDARLVAALVRLDRRDVPIAELHRRLGAVADEIGLTRPSYQQVRVVLHALRSNRRHPGAGELLLDLTLSTQSKRAILRILEDLTDA